MSIVYSNQICIKPSCLQCRKPGTAPCSCWDVEFNIPDFGPQVMGVPMELMVDIFFPGCDPPPPTTIPESQSLRIELIDIVP